MTVEHFLDSMILKLSKIIERQSSSKQVLPYPISVTELRALYLTMAVRQAGTCWNDIACLKNAFCTRWWYTGDEKVELGVVGTLYSNNCLARVCTQTQNSNTQTFDCEQLDSPTTSLTFTYRQPVYDAAPHCAAMRYIIQYFSTSLYRALNCVNLRPII